MEVAVGLIRQWIQADGRSGMSKINVKSTRNVQLNSTRKNKLNPIAYDIFSFFQLRGGGGGAFWPTPQKTQLGQSD